MRIIFFGSDDFAAVHLNAIMTSGHEVVCCVTSPDKAQGRGMKITASPIKVIAGQRQIPCLQPMILKETSMVERLANFKADVFVVVAYGRLLTREILEIPKFLCMNVHGSLLPRYRGAAPVNWAILNGDQETGVSIQKMVLTLDAGDIIAQEKMEISLNDTAESLRQKMSAIGAQLLVKVLGQKPESTWSMVAQDEQLVTFAPKLTKEMGRIQWDRPASKIVNQVRGLKPWPGSHVFYKGRMLKISDVQMSLEDMMHAQPGEIVKVDKLGFHVACQDRAILVKEVHPEAGKLMPASSFMAGYKIVVGDFLIGDSSLF